MVFGAFLGILHLFQVCKGHHVFLCRLVCAHGVVVCGCYWVSLGGEEDKVVMSMLSGSCPHYHYLYSLSGISFEELKIRIRKCDMPFSKGI